MHSRVYFYGAPGSGKSQLISRLANKPSLEQKEEEEPLKLTRIQDFDSHADPCLIDAWELSPKYMDLLKQTTERDCIVFTFDCTQDMGDQEDVMRDAFNAAKDAGGLANILFIVTKTDVPKKERKFDPEDIIETARFYGLPAKDVLFCSAESGENVAKILPHIKKQLKAQERIVISKDELLKMIARIKNEVIAEILQPELNRLNDKKPLDKIDRQRIKDLTLAIGDLEHELEELKKNPQRRDLAVVMNSLETPLSKRLHNFDKRQGLSGWGTKLGCSVLNVLTSIAFPAALAKKKWGKSHTYFYSLHGKTYDEGKKALDEIKRI